MIFPMFQFVTTVSSVHQEPLRGICYYDDDLVILVQSNGSNT